jgi:hypothetical protein
MYLSHQTVLIIHEERVNELLGKKRMDYDNGLAAAWQRLWQQWRSWLAMQNAADYTETQTAPRRTHRSTQEMALVSKQ